jgi:hypothetical protein
MVVYRHEYVNGVSWWESIGSKVMEPNRAGYGVFSLFFSEILFLFVYKL